MKIFCFGFSFFFLMSCATVPPPQQDAYSALIERPYDSVWQAVIESLSELQFPILSEDKQSGRLTTDWVTLRRLIDEGYCDCGYLEPKMVESNLRVKLIISINLISKSTCKMEIGCSYEQNITDLFGKKPKKNKCKSTGKLESKICELVNSKIALAQK